MTLASLVIFRVFFCILYMIKWKYRFWFSKAYKIETYNLDSEFKRLKS